MSEEIETTMEDHQATEFWGGDDRGVCLQITASAPMRACKTVEEQVQQEGYIQLTMEEAAILCGVLHRFVKSEANRRQELLGKELARLKYTEQSVFTEVMKLNDVFDVPELAVLMVSKFCPKV